MRRVLSLVGPFFSLASLASLAGAVGCERVLAAFEKAGEQGRRPPPLPGPESPAPSSRRTEEGFRTAAPNAGRPHAELDPATRRKMKLAPRRTAAPDLAFGKGRLGVLTEDSLTVRDVARFSEALRFPLDHPRALAALADGSLFAAGASRSLRLLPHDEKPLPVPKITLFPESSLFGDRRAPDRVWVLPGNGRTLFGYDALRGTGTLVTAAEWIELDDYDEHGFTSVRDGSFLYSTPQGLLRFYGSGRKEPISSSLEGGNSNLRLLPASRPDTVWAVAERTARLLRILAGKLVSLKSIELGAAVYDAAAEGELLAVLELVQPDDAPWRFELEVFDVGGARHGRAALPAEETVGEDWVARLVQNRGLAISADPPMVAVGGRAHLDVLSARDGSRVFSAP